MVELYMIACAAAGHCKDVSLTFAADSVTPMQLQAQAQPAIAKWCSEHPGWRIARYGARRVRNEAKI